MSHTRSQLRQDTAANWTAANPVLLKGEEGLETDSRKLKIGDGSTQWTSLPYEGSTASPSILLPYFASVPVPNTEQARISRCIQSIIDAGLIGNLVDAGFFRPGQNTGTNSPLTLKLAQGMLEGSVGYGQNGLVFNGTGNLATFPVSPTPAFTVVADVQFSPTTGVSDSAVISMQNSAGAATSMQGVVWTGSNPVTFYSRQGSTQTQTSSLPGTGSFLDVSRYSFCEQVLGFSSDGALTPSVSIYTDAVSVFTTSSGTTQSTSDLNRIVLGAFDTGTWGYNGTIANFFLFNKVLSTEEHAAVVDAVRHLDPKPVNIVIIGDSLSAQFSQSNMIGSNWPWQLLCLPRFAGRARLINHGHNGVPAYGLDPLMETWVLPYAANGTSVLEALCFAWVGMAGFKESVSADTEWSAAQSIYSKARSKGMTVTAFTNHRSQLNVGLGLSTAQDLERQTFNTNVRASPNLYDTLIDIETLLSDKVATNTPYRRDELHPSTLGNGIVASFISEAKSSNVFPLCITYMSTNQTLTGGNNLDVAKFDTVIKDTHGIFNVSTNSVTIPVFGDYVIGVSCMFWLNGSNTALQTLVLVNGSTTYRISLDFLPEGDGRGSSGEAIITLNAGDVVQIGFIQDQGIGWVSDSAMGVSANRWNLYRLF